MAQAVTASGLGRAYGVETVARWQLPQGAMLSATYTLFRSEFTNRAGADNSDLRGTSRGL